MQRFMTQEGSRGPAKIAASPNNRDEVLSQKNKAGGKFDGTMNTSMNIQFMHKKYEKIDKFLNKVQNEIKSRQNAPVLETTLSHDSTTNPMWLNASMSMDGSELYQHNSVTSPFKNKLLTQSVENSFLKSGTTDDAFTSKQSLDQRCDLKVPFLPIGAHKPK